MEQKFAMYLHMISLNYENSMTKNKEDPYVKLQYLWCWIDSMKDLLLDDEIDLSKFKIKFMKLIEIISYERKDGFIVVNLDDNKYTNDTISIIPDRFNEYLKRNDKLYYETNDIVGGVYVNKAFNMDMDEYFEQMSISDIEDDLYDYIISNHLKIDRSTLTIKKSLETLLNNFNFNK